MTALIAEDLLLLLLDDEKGTLATSYSPAALGGAVLIELALAGAVTVEPKASAWHSAKVRVDEDAAATDPVLQAALVTISEKDRSAQDLVDRLGKGLGTSLRSGSRSAASWNAATSGSWGCSPARAGRLSTPATRRRCAGR